jgi:hypothetical protein
MAKKKRAKAPAPIHGATPKDESITLGGKEYHLLFNYRALEVAEMKLEAEGHTVNMLLQLDPRTVGANRLPFLFFAALVSRHPEITFKAAKALVNFRTSMPIHNAVMDAYVAGMVDPAAKKDDEDDPTPEPAAAP